MLMNKQAYKVEKDKLIYDGKHPIDVENVSVAITPTKAGEIKRGQVLDCADGVFGLHASSGTPSVIVAETVPYAQDDTEVIVTVYTSGTFRTSEVTADPELTDKDRETLRTKGIYLK